MIEPRGNRTPWRTGLVAGILIAGILAIYGPSVGFDFVNLDDPQYVYSNPIVEQGLTWHGVRWAFSTFECGNWNPLVWLSHMADCQLFDLRAGGHHAINVLLHAANSVLLLFLLEHLTGALWRSALVAAVFAWHPMHAESVAWISERKDVLGALFWMLTIWAYAASVRQANRRKLFYILSLFFFTLGLMSKPMLVPLPLILLLLDFWPLQRSEPLRGLVMEKIPFLALSLAASLLTIWSQHSVGAMMAAEPLPLRIENALVSCGVYLTQFFAPANMAMFYPFPHFVPAWQWVGAALLLAGITWAVLVQARTRRYLIVGWLWFLAALAPVIGLIQVGMQSRADRYTYIPYIGVAIILAWGFQEVCAAWLRVRTMFVALSSIWLFGCCVVARTQAGYWRSNVPLFEHSIKVTSGNYMALDHLGQAFMADGKLDEAMSNFQEVLRLRPGAALPYNDVGNVYALQHKLDDALSMFQKAISLDPDFSQARCNAGNALLLKGNYPAAMEQLKIALELNPADAIAQRHMADALIRSGRAAEAVPYCENAVRLEPKGAYNYYALGYACMLAGDPRRALVNFKKSLQLAPQQPECLNALAWMYATSPASELRDGQAAIELAAEACALTGRTNGSALDTLGCAYAEAGKFIDAIKTADELAALGSSRHDTNLTQMARQRLELFKAGKPWREKP